ncbi:cephalotoxin-like protein [Austrofundulus limnaeus]|uniref:Cephalotoxin-like protein n=1 Tax=Austrofundulus limnaeus TaxID=52670 RepID=A0A2I4D712_AUSLI|nr:PREDICTED: cephalotoxin-like protein [Austrofundulus limnaeus]
MAPKTSALMLAWLVLLWVNFSLSSQSSSLALNRVKKDMVPESRMKKERALNIAKESLSLLTDIVKDTDTKILKDVMRAISEIAKLAPVHGAVISCFINVLLIFIPEEDPVMQEIKKGFAEVNRKLDSISIQISKLEADVEWFNYVSVYSRDERIILNAWMKYQEFKVSDSSRTEEENIRLAELYIRYYENSGVESSVSNLYHYLTVRSTSLSENINNLLRKKFRCDINQIGRYNIYLSSLLWKGMILKQFYWTLIDLNSAAKEAEHVKMFKEVSKAQLSAMQFCLDNHTQYMKMDVEEIAKQFSSDQKTDIAVQVKKALDEKYNWYNWVVVVFDKGQKKKSHVVYRVQLHHWQQHCRRRLHR